MQVQFGANARPKESLNLKQRDWKAPRKTTDEGATRCGLRDGAHPEVVGVPGLKRHDLVVGPGLKRPETPDRF